MPSVIDLAGTLRRIAAAVALIPTGAERGTDNAALAADWTAALATALGNYTAARAGYLDELAAANLPTDVAAIPTTPMRGTDSAALASSWTAALATTLGTLTLAAINAEVVDVLATDTYAESAGVVDATATLAAMITWLKTLARNKITQTSTVQTLRNNADDGSIATAAVSDDGVTAIRGEFA